MTHEEYEEKIIEMLDKIDSIPLIRRIYLFVIVVMRECE